MTPQDKEKILNWCEKLSKEIHITLILSDDCQESEALKGFCNTLSSLVPEIVVQEKRAEEDILPAIEIGSRLSYRAVPLGPELAPFLEALMFQEGLSNELPKDILDKLDKVRVPAKLRLYIAPQCPFCPATVRKLVPLAFACEYVSLQVIDGVSFPESAESDGIQSAPTLVYEDFKWTGAIDLHELVDVMTNRDPAALSAETLKDMIQEGGASQVARMMIESQKIFPGFIDLLVHEKWPVRLGAMVVAEEIMEYDPGLAVHFIEPVWRRFGSLDDQAKGDMIYLTGETGGLDMISRLKDALIGLSGDELRTVVDEAIESIEERHKKGRKA